MGKHSIRPYFAALLAAFMLILVLPAQATAATQIERVDLSTDTFCNTSFFTSNVIVNDNNTTILFHSRFTLDVFAPCVSTASGREQFAVHFDNTAPITQVSRDHSFQQSHLCRVPRFTCADLHHHLSLPISDGRNSFPED